MAPVRRPALALILVAGLLTACGSNADPAPSIPAAEQSAVRAAGQELVAHRCPPTAPKYLDHQGSTDGSLVPVDAVELVVCPLTPPTMPPATGNVANLFRFQPTVITDKTTVTAMRTRINGLAAEPTSLPFHACMIVDGQEKPEFLLGFIASAHEYVLLHVGQFGCDMIFSGATTRVGHLDDSLRGDLATLS